MKEANRRRRDRLRRQLLGEPEPDMTGWDVMDQLEWYARNGRLAELIMEAEKLSDAEPARSPPREFAGDQRKPIEPAAAAASHASLPEPEPEPPPALPPPMFTPDADEQRRLDWLNETARWRLREDDDHYWEQPSGGVIHEYDPLAEE